MMRSAHPAHAALPTAAAILLLAAAASVLAPAHAAAQESETLISQGLAIAMSANASIANIASPFSRLSSAGELSIGSTLSTAYSLGFLASGVSARAAVSAASSASGESRFALDQAWVRASLAEGWGLKFGRFDLNWRDGGRSNPSDLVNARAAWGEEGPLSGRDAVELLGTIPLGVIALDLNLATTFSSDYGSFADLPLYAALGTILYPLELRLKAALPSGAPPLFGGAAKCALGSLNVYADALWLREASIAAQFGESIPGNSALRFCLGANQVWGFESNQVFETLSIGAEYLRQGDGLTREQGEAYFAGLHDADLSTPAAQQSYAEEAALWGGRFFELYQDYLYLSIGLGGIARRDIALGASLLANLDDGSFAISSSLSWEPRGRFSIRLSALNCGSFAGGSGGEAASSPLEARYAMQFSKSF